MQFMAGTVMIMMDIVLELSFLVVQVQEVLVDVCMEIVVTEDLPEEVVIVVEGAEVVDVELIIVLLSLAFLLLVGLVFVCDTLFAKFSGFLLSISRFMAGFKGSHA